MLFKSFCLSCCRFMKSIPMISNIGGTLILSFFFRAKKKMKLRSPDQRVKALTPMSWTPNWSSLPVLNTPSSRWKRPTESSDQIPQTPKEYETSSGFTTSNLSAIILDYMYNNAPTAPMIKALN